MKLTFNADTVPLGIVFACFAEPEKALLHFKEEAEKTGCSGYEATQVAIQAIESIQLTMIEWVTGIFEDITKEL